ncbi:MAG: hypothetical protein V4726_05970 [Verrucomicrobiota bacterium]
MRGFPLINLLAVLGALTALLIPLLRLNTPARAVEAPASSERPAAAETPVALNLRFVREPVRFEVKAEGRILPFSGTGLERSARVGLPLREEALELEVNVTWPAEAAGSVAEISVSPDSRGELKQNVWADGTEASEVLRFEWKK